MRPHKTNIPIQSTTVQQYTLYILHNTHCTHYTIYIKYIHSLINYKYLRMAFNWHEDWLVHRFGFERKEKHCANPLIRPYVVKHKQFRDMEKKLFKTWNIERLYGKSPRGFKQKVLECLNSSNLQLANTSKIYMLERSFPVLMGAQIIGPIRGLHHFIITNTDEILVFRATREREISLQDQAARVIANNINSREDLQTLIQQHNLPKYVEELISNIV